jgi:hypothetical protein
LFGSLWHSSVDFTSAFQSSPCSPSSRSS